MMADGWVGLIRHSAGVSQRQHGGFHCRIKGSLRRAAPALDTEMEPTQVSTEAFLRS
jgi:hypothetical protein